MALIMFFFRLYFVKSRCEDCIALAKWLGKHNSYYNSIQWNFQIKDAILSSVERLSSS